GPDLFRRDISADDRTMLRVTWSVDSAPAQWLHKLDAIALACLDATQQIESRWLRLAPRHLGRMAQGVRMLVADRDFASRFVDQVRGQVETGDIGATVAIRQIENGRVEEHRFT